MTQQMKGSIMVMGLYNIGIVDTLQISLSAGYKKALQSM